MKRKQSGNMILMLFGAIAVAGVLGTGYMSTMKGPGRALSESSRENSIENNMLAATKLVVSGDAAQQDCDGDGTIEPMAFRTGTGPTGGGLVPLSSGAVKNDTWGKPLGYCVWDHGKKSVSDNVTTCGGSGANRLQGGNVTTENVLAIVSAGKDGIFQTTCNAWVDANTDNIADTPLIVTTPGSDDIVKRDTIESLMSSGALAQLPTLPDSACIVGAEGTMRYENGVPQVCSGSPTPAWKEIGGASGATANFAPTTGVNPSSTQTSGTITMSGYFGSRTVTVDQGATLIVNSVDTGVSSYDVPVGATVAIKGTAAAGYLTLKTFILKIGTISKTWGLTTRAATVAAFSVSPATSSGMNVTGPGSPAYGSSVQFTVTNTGETLSAAINAIGFSPATNFETTGTNLCSTYTVAGGATCTFYARPKATADGALSSTMTVSATGATSGAATLSGTASGFITNFAATQLAAGASYTCGLAPDGKAYCWGYNTNGQLGDNSTTQRLTPVLVANGAGPGTYTQLTAGDEHTCGIANTNSKAYCWGYNSRGGLGDNSTTDRLTPVLAANGAGPGTYTQLVAGYDHTCGIASTNSKAYCWGWNALGQLGDNSTTQRLTPVLTQNGVGPGTYTQLTSDYDHTCGIASTDSKAYCWGDNQYGKLGDGGTTGLRLTPVLAVNGAGLGTYTQLIAGFYSSCGVSTTGMAYCWGYNGSGQLGDNSSTTRHTPVSVLAP